MLWPGSSATRWSLLPCGVRGRVVTHLVRREERRRSVPSEEEVVVDRRGRWPCFFVLFLFLCLSSFRKISTALSSPLSTTQPTHAEWRSSPTNPPSPPQHYCRLPPLLRSLAPRSRREDQNRVPWLPAPGGLWRHLSKSRPERARPPLTLSHPARTPLLPGCWEASSCPCGSSRLSTLTPAQPWRPPPPRRDPCSDA